MTTRSRAADDPCLQDCEGGARRTLGWVVLIVVVIAAAYCNSFHGPFIFDDIGCIIENPSIRHLWPPGPVLSPSSEGGRTVAGRPIVNLSLAINYAISGLDVWSYHVLNLLIHLGAALVLWGVLRRTIRIRGSDGVAAAIALLWALHPLNTESVTYVVQRAESLMALCYLLTLYCVIRSGSSESRAWQIAALIACAAGMATKEVMVTAPLLVLLYDRTFLAGSFRRALAARWPLYSGLAATWVIPVLLHGGRGASAGFSGPIGVRDYALTQLRFVPHYLRLSFWPRPLVFDYGTPLVSRFADVWPQAALLAALLIATIIALAVHPAAGFLGASFFLILAPSSSIIPISTQTAAEHRMYLPLAAVLALVVLAIRWTLGRALPGRIRGRLGASLLALACAGLAGATIERNRDYATWLAIWKDTIAKAPGNPRAWHNLSLHYFRAGQYKEAADSSRQAVRIQASFPDGLLQLANSEAALGLNEQAIEDYGRAIEVAPRNPAPYLNRGNSCFAIGRFEKAIDDYNRAIGCDARNATAYYSRALTEAKLQRHSDAILSLNEAIRLKPDYDVAISERALLYYVTRQYEKAWEDVRAYERLGKTASPQFIERLSKAANGKQGS